MDSSNTHTSGSAPNANRSQLQQRTAGGQLHGRTNAHASPKPIGLQKAIGLIIAHSFGTPMTANQINRAGNLSNLIDGEQADEIGLFLVNNGIQAHQENGKTKFFVSGWPITATPEDLDRMRIAAVGKTLPPLEIPDRPDCDIEWRKGNQQYPQLGYVDGLEDWLAHSVLRVGSLFIHGGVTLVPVGDLADMISMLGYWQSIHEEDVTDICLKLGFKVGFKNNSIAYNLKPILFQPDEN